jgi:hypothetical protein
VAGSGDTWSGIFPRIEKIFANHSDDGASKR